ncbi:hypothetical protein DAEQUDRAFT_722553 [Daedalea quercina L-15889]|uniref:Uncharacterized protein n=1 Tax=Daedalea quercina L-15889 TaxID=1314783 RepID=A0A165T4I5_9APHY|nr:hypothetical protein DAEQUDRAFT_722553 [Daedalea quercina L-15889]
MAAIQPSVHIVVFISLLPGCVSLLVFALHLVSSSGFPVPFQMSFLRCSDQSSMWIYPTPLSYSFTSGGAN